MAKRKTLHGAQRYDVGYGKPPKSGQFQKGVSGFRAGRRKGSKNIATLLIEALGEHVTVTENGTRRRMSKLEVMFKQLVNQGAAGDLRALGMILQRVDGAETQVEGRQSEVLDDSDTEVFEALIKRIRKAPQETGHE
jgi:Family of unknown function (DUF5681)